MNRVYHKDGSPPEHGEVFVFGSNLSGIHGGGAARAAHKLYGARWGIAEGPTGRCYAIPTVRENIAGALSLELIRPAIERFLRHAVTHANTLFFVTRIGCGLAGHNDADIAPMFVGAPNNCDFPDTWEAYLK